MLSMSENKVAPPQDSLITPGLLPPCIVLQNSHAFSKKKAYTVAIFNLQPLLLLSLMQVISRTN